MKKKTLIIVATLLLVLGMVEPVLAADAFAKVEGSLKNVVISFQKVLKWVGIGAFLFGTVQYILGRKQQGKFFMTSAVVGFCLVMAVYFIFSLIESTFAGLV